VQGLAEVSTIKGYYAYKPCHSRASNPVKTKEKHLDGKATEYVNLVGAMALDDFETGMKWGEM